MFWFDGLRIDPDVSVPTLAAQKLAAVPMPELEPPVNSAGRPSLKPGRGSLPEVLRYVAGPLQAMTGGRLDAAILRQLLIALAMISVMLMRPRGLWPAPTHGKSLQNVKPPVPGEPGSTALN